MEDRSVSVVIEMTTLGRRKDFWRLVSGVRQGVSRPIRECEWDMGGGFTKSGPGDSQTRFPRSFFLSVSYGPLPPDAGARTGRSEVDGSDPPFLLPASGAGVLRDSHLRNTPWGGRSRLNYPCRKARRKTVDRVDLSPQTPQWRQNPWRLTLPPVNPALVAGRPAPPNPPDANRHRPTKELSNEGSSFVRTTSPPLWKIKDFPQGASFCFQFNLASDLPSPQPHPDLHDQAEFRKQDRVLPTARAPDLADHLTGCARAEKSPLRREAQAEPGCRPGAYACPLVRLRQADTGQMAGLFFHDLTRIPARGGFKRDLSAGDRFAPAGKPARGAAGIRREGPIFMGRDK